MVLAVSLSIELWMHLGVYLSLEELESHSAITSLALHFFGA